MELNFTKMHGLGNDFVVIDDLSFDLDFSEEAVIWLCDRHFGIGADGLMLVRPATLSDADFAWWFRNADGSVAEMCGNGIRCFAKYLVDRGLVAADQDVVRVETLIGVLTIQVTRDYDGTLAFATVDMGEPTLSPAAIPTAMRCGTNEDMVVACPLETEVGTFDVTPVSMGNPHCVIFVDDVDDAPVHTVGPIIETHPAFPNKTNVEFAQVVADDLIRLRVWERGCGETLACGTGACATTVAAALTCRIGREATVELPGGDLQIRWAEDNHVYMTGPAAESFSGTVTIPEDDA
ncbi:MAG TPA: diaminopimelate epimerase [Coriobacteriia bacterium]|nr:diaminopimelate epimerase [Coriobacteriia bacterium]